MRKISEVIGEAAAKIAKEIGANSILSVEAVPDVVYTKEDTELEVKVAIFRKVESKKYKKIEYKTKIKNQEFGSIAPVKEVLMHAISKDHVKKGDRLVCIEDSSVGIGYQGVLFIFKIDDTFFKISRQKLSENADSSVVEAVVSIAKEIGEEGREGRRIGTGFIIGEPKVLAKYTRQMIINPFANMEEQPKITDPKMKETIKEFAQLDGVFIIDTDGSIISAGTYINIDHSCIDLPDGFGTKHRASCALTTETDAIAVIVSESGGKVRAIKNGKIILKI